MRALVCHAYGPIESLKLEDVPEPRPAAGEIVVKVGAAGVDFALLMMAAHAVPPGAQIMAVAKGLLLALAVIAVLGIIVIELRAVVVDVALEAAIPAIAIIIIMSGSGLRQAKGQKSESADGQCER